MMIISFSSSQIRQSKDGAVVRVSCVTTRPS